MSVILFGVSDLANVILAATETAPECDARLALQRTMATILAAYSEANTAAFRARAAAGLPFLLLLEGSGLGCAL